MTPYLAIARFRVKIKCTNFSSLNFETRVFAYNWFLIAALFPVWISKRVFLLTTLSNCSSCCMLNCEWSLTWHYLLKSTSFCAFVDVNRVSLHWKLLACEMFVCVMFANHSTIVALHANSFCKYLKLLAQILLIKLCLQCITGAVRLAPVRSKSRWLYQFPVYQHAITFERSLPRQIFCEKSTRRSNGQTTKFEEVRWFKCFSPKLSHNCHTILLIEISPCCAVFLFVVLIR